MIIKSLNNFSQNVQKNKLLTNMILENFNILFIQESSWLIIQQLLSFIFEKGKDLIGASHYPS